MISLIFSFSIESYNSNATILENGDLNVYEKITFGLDQNYNEGFRSIRPEDVENIDNLIVHSVKLNGDTVNYYSQKNGQFYEIVWTETTVGTNLIELDYTLKNRVELWDDYAKLCFEHYGANWNVPAKQFEARMTLPESTKGKTFHFEIYSNDNGDTNVEAQTIVTRMSNVPSGNYIGGCYLFNKDFINTSKIVNGSAYAILKNEREMYGSKETYNSIDEIYDDDYDKIDPDGFEDFDFPKSEICCIPVFVILIIMIGVIFYTRNNYPKYPENIIPPEKIDPVIVANLLNSKENLSNVLAATILNLINKGVIDIVELEKKENNSDDIKREKTILMLKKTDARLSAHEKIVVNMLFSENKLVDLDQLVENFKSIKTRTDALCNPITIKIDAFESEIKKILDNSQIHEFIGNRKKQNDTIIFIVILGAMISQCMLIDTITTVLTYLDVGNLMGIILAGGSFICNISLAYFLVRTVNNMSTIPKDQKILQRYAKWKAFEQTVKSNRLKEYPPASVVIWGDILVYATALGIADKVNIHLSELDNLTAEKIAKINKVGFSCIRYSSRIRQIKNISERNRRSRHSSSGGRSRRGGGFSHRSSGGGGFR